MKLCEGCGACFDDAADRCAFDGGALTIAFPGPRVVGGRYLLEQRISSGAMGVVFRAAHLQVGSTVAVKLMRPQQVGRRVALQRFRREAQILGQIKHPNAVLVIDFGVDEKDRADLPYLVMEFLRGEPLDDVMRRKRTFTIAELDRLLHPLCEAVEEAHQVGVIHRDVKPSNVFLERLRGGDEIVKVLDFGIAKFVELEGAARPAPITLPDAAPVDDDLEDALDDNDFLDEVFDIRTDGPHRPTAQPTKRDAPARGARAKSPTTEAGFMIGTVPYMAPEQMTGESVSRRTDVHAVAVLAFQLLSGRLPFDGDDDDIIAAKLADERPSLREIGVDVPAELDAVLSAAFAVDPTARPASVMDVAAAVRAATRGQSGPRGGRAGDVVVELTAVAASLEALDAALTAWSDDPDEDTYGRARDLLLSADLPLARARRALDDAPGPSGADGGARLEGAHTQLDAVLVDLQRRLALLVERTGPAAEYAVYLAALWSRLQGAAQALVDDVRRLLDDADGGDGAPAFAPSMFDALAIDDDGALASLAERLHGRDALDAADALDELLDEKLDALVAALSRADAEGKDLGARLAGALWRHADALLLRETFPSTTPGGARGRRGPRVLPILAARRDLPAAAPFVELARLLSTRGDVERALAEAKRALAGPLAEAPRGVLARALLLHPVESVRAHAASTMDLAGFWSVVAHPGTPLSLARFVFERVRARAPAEYLKIFFFCVVDHLRAASGPAEIDEAFAMLRRFFAVPCFHEDVVFEPLLEVERVLRARALAAGAVPPEEASYTEALASFAAEGSKDAVPLDNMVDVPLPIQRKLAREGLFLQYFVSHAVERVARETLPHLLRLEDVTRYLRIPTIHRAVLVELSKRKRLFRKDAPRIALLTNPKTPALVARGFIPLVSEDQLRLLAANKHINADVRRLVKTTLARTK